MEDWYRLRRRKQGWHRHWDCLWRGCHREWRCHYDKDRTGRRTWGRRYRPRWDSSWRTERVSDRHSWGVRSSDGRSREYRGQIDRNEGKSRRGSYLSGFFSSLAAGTVLLYTGTITISFAYHDQSLWTYLTRYRRNRKRDSVGLAP